tara:strand:- start:2786 stop:5539 length:2754 start_codon:yes stop_codon:yes gene_type:complete
MSTQLILYPQNYEGQYNFTATPSPDEFIVNGISFTGLNSTTLYNTTDTSPSESAIINSPPLLLGNWYRYTTTGGPWGTVVPPVVGAGKLSLSFNAALDGHSGIYQQLSGLTVGALYDVVINIDVPVNGLLTIQIYSGTYMEFDQQISSFTSQITQTFVAQSTNHTFLLDYVSSTAAIEVLDISIKGSSADTPNLIYTELNDGQVICDLYQEEDIPLSLSIDDFKNVAEQVKSYSKDFNLPATKRNNQIFNNMFEVTRVDNIRGIIFNPYRRTQCVLKQDGFILFEGYLRLIDVKDKDGEISYNVNLYSDVLALADILKDQTFAELDFTELEHDYTFSNIRESWQGTLGLINPLPTGSFAGGGGLYTTSVLKYPFIDWNHQFLQDATTGFPILPNLESAFRPCISLKYLINKIFAASGFNWTSNFFNSADFGKLYMDFNWGSGNAPVNFDTTGSSIVKATDADNYAGTSYSNILVPNNYWGDINLWETESGYDLATSVFTSLLDNTLYYIHGKIQLIFIADTDVTIEWLSTTDGIVDQMTYSGIAGDTVTHQSTIWTTLNTGDTLVMRFKAVHAGRVKQNNTVVEGGLLYGNISSAVFTTATLLQNLRGELGQWDFLKGIMTMFNLVSLVDEADPNNILIEPYSDVFINNTNSGTTSDMTLASRSIQHDWTEKVDISEMELKPLTDLNKSTVFKFVEDDDDYAFNVFKNAQSGHLYGSLKWNASGFTILEGEEEVIAAPFAATVSIPLREQFTDFVVPAIYSMAEDGTCEGFDNSPRIFYNNGVKTLTSCTYNVPSQNCVTPPGCGDAFEDEFLQFSHLSDIPTTTSSRDFVFRSTQLPTSVGSAPADNLFSLYWQPYFNELYSADTRTMTLKVNLSPTDVANFKFFDVVFIKNRSFRVNKIDYKPNDLATVEFILIP